MASGNALGELHTREQPDWSVSFLWVLWTVGSAAVGLSISNSLANLEILDAVPQIIGLLTVGAFVGIGQWHVLRRFIPVMSWIEWTSYTTVGVGVGWIAPLVLAWAIRYTPFIIVFGAAGGAMFGFSQWLVMAQYVERAYWWVLVTTIAGAVMFVLNYLPEQVFLNNNLFGILVATLITAPAIPWLMMQLHGVPAV